MKEFVAALIGGTVAAVVGLAADYFIQYQLVDKPKVEVDRQRILLDAHQAISALTPRISPLCTLSLDKAVPTAHAQCVVKNEGQHAIELSISEIDLGTLRIENQGYTRNRVAENEGFKVEFVQSERERVSIVPGQSYIFFFDIVRPHQTGKKVVSQIVTFKPHELVVRATLVAKASSPAKVAFLQHYPTLEEFIDQSSKRTQKVVIRFESRSET